MRLALLRRGVAGVEISRKSVGLKTGRGIGGSLNVMAPSLVRIIDQRGYAGVAALLSLYELLLHTVMTIAAVQRHPLTII